MVPPLLLICLVQEYSLTLRSFFSFRLLDRNKAMALDIPKFYRQARAQFAVRHNSSNRFLGYALLLPEVTVEDNEVRLIPWPWMTSSQMTLLLLFMRSHNLLLVSLD